MMWDKLLLLSLAFGFLAIRSVSSDTFECVDKTGSHPICGSNRCIGGTVCVNSCNAVSCNATCVERVKVSDICSIENICGPGTICTAAKKPCAQGTHLPTAVCSVSCGSVICLSDHCVVHTDPKTGAKEHKCVPAPPNAEPNGQCSEQEADQCEQEFGFACVQVHKSVVCVPR